MIQPPETPPHWLEGLTGLACALALLLAGALLGAAIATFHNASHPTEQRSRP